MTIADRFFRRGRKTRAVPALDLGGLRACFSAGVARFAGKVIEPALVRARLADGVRDTGLTPLLPEDFAERTAGLDAEGWRRLALVVAALEREEVGAALAAAEGKRGLGVVLDDGFFRIARERSLLTLDLLQQSALRVEEMARHFLAGLGAPVEGETPAQSRQRLERLDYARLLEQAEKAKVSAEERMEYLRKLQDEQEKKGPRRGKW